MIHKRTTGITTTPTSIHPGTGTSKGGNIVVITADSANTGAVLLGEPGTLTTSNYGHSLAANASITIPAEGNAVGIAALASTGTVAVSVLVL